MSMENRLGWPRAPNMSSLWDGHLTYSAFQVYLPNTHTSAGSGAPQNLRNQFSTNPLWAQLLPILVVSLGPVTLSGMLKCIVLINGTDHQVNN